MATTAAHDVPLVKAAAPKFESITYTTSEKAEVEQWLITSSHLADTTQDSAQASERLSSLNTHLSTRTTILGSKPSVADVAIYHYLAPFVKQWSPEQRTGEQGYHHIVRHLDFVQNASVFGLDLDAAQKVQIDPSEVVAIIKPIDAKAEKERKKKEKAAAAAAGADSAAAAGATVTSAASAPVQAAEQSQPAAAAEEKKSTGEAIAAAVGAAVPGVKKEKKEKAPKQPKPAKAPAAEKPFSPALIDLRVGHILKAIAHPNADSLYVSTIACGDAAGTENTSEYEGQVQNSQSVELFTH